MISNLSFLFPFTNFYPYQSCYREFSRCVHQLRHIMLLKYDVLAHWLHPGSSSPLDSCAIECPYCPYPGWNIPGNCFISVQEISWLLIILDQFYAHLYYSNQLYLSACFDCRYKFLFMHKERGIYDKSFSDALAYVVQCNAYNSFMNSVPDCNEVFSQYILSFYIIQTVPRKICVIPLCMLLTKQTRRV